MAGAERRREKMCWHQFETHQLVVEDSEACRESLLSLAPHNSCLVRERSEYLHFQKEESSGWSSLLRRLDV